MTASNCHRAVAVRVFAALGLVVLCAAAAVAQDVPVDPTAPRIATNRKAHDTETKLELLQQELYSAQQDIMFLTLQQQNSEHMQVRRTLFPSDKELIPGYVFTPKPLDRGRKYPGLVVVHGGWHGRLDWRFFDLIDYAVSKGYVVMFPEYRGSSGYGDVHFKNNYGTTDT